MGSGSGRIDYSVEANSTGSTRVGSISIGGQAFTILQEGTSTPCAIGPISIGQSINSVLTNGDCQSPIRINAYAKRWTFSGTAGQQIAIRMTGGFDAYLSLLRPTGTLVGQDDNGGGGSSARLPAGSGLLTLPDSGIYTIETSSAGGLATGTFTVELTGPDGCAYQVSPMSRNVETSAAVNGTLTVTTAAGCGWSASSNVNWISINSSGNGSGAGVTLYGVHANNTTSSRTGTIRIAGQTVTITQAGLPAACATATLSIGSSITGFLANGGGCTSSVRGTQYLAARYSFTGMAGQRVALTMSSSSVDSYLLLIGPQGNVIAEDDDSAGNLNARIPSSGLLRLSQTGTYIVEATSFAANRGGSFTISLEGGCTFSVTPTSANYAAGGGSGSVNVTASGPSCDWSAVSSSPWVTLSGGTQNRFGSGAVGFFVASNSTGGPRNGSLVVAGTTVNVLQSNSGVACSAAPINFPATVNGALLNSDCFSPSRGNGHYADRYTFNGVVGQRVSIALTSGAFDTFVYLIGPDGNVLQSNDDGGDGSNSRIPSESGLLVLPAAGTYTIEVTSFAQNQLGNYTLTTAGDLPTAAQGPFRFVPVTPCRVADTRRNSGFTGVFGAPTMAAGTTRVFPIPLSRCGIPATARVYSLNFTVVPQGPLGFLTTWPSDQNQPLVSTLNSPNGAVVANAAIVPASSNGSISVYVSGTSDLVIDVNGYFAP